MGKKRRYNDGVYLRNSTWWLDCRINGTRYQFPLGKGVSRSVAAELAQVKRTAILRGEVGIGKKKKDITFEKASELFLESVEERVELGDKLGGKKGMRPSTLRGYKENVGALKKHFSGKKLSEIHPFLLKKYRLKRKDSPIAFNREMSCLSSMVNWCKGQKKFEGDNPTTEVERFEEHHRERVLSHEEEHELLVNANEPARTIILLGIYTGFRAKSEILTLRKDDVDLEGGYLTVKAAYAKNKERQTVPLHPQLIGPLKEQMERSRSEWLFVKKDGVSRLRSFRTAFSGACRRAKLTDVTPHALRHTFATRLATECNTDVITVKQLGRWKRMEMVERYVNPSDEHKIRAINSMQLPTDFTTPQNHEITELPQVAENK